MTDEGIAHRPTLDHARLAFHVEGESDLRCLGDFGAGMHEKERVAYMFELAFGCMRGCSPSDCAPSVAPVKFGICGIGGGDDVPFLAPFKRLLGAVGVFFGRSNGAAVFDDVPGRPDSAPSAYGAELSDASLEL